jgi:DNA-binding CsgD family transcriptional regulator/ABC-type cobalamin/Fe3+-siderophores transport system ATPase subunit
MKILHIDSSWLKRGPEMLIERYSQMDRLGALLTDSAAGHGSVAVIDGAVGSGKTSLLHAFAERAHAAGAAVLSANCSQAERSLPVGVVRQLFYDADLPGRHAERVATLLGTSVTALADAGAVADDAVHVLHALCTALLDLAKEQTVVACIDDVQDADSSSLFWLLYLVRRLRRARIMLVVAQSASHVSAYSRFLVEMERHPHCHRIPLAPLSDEGVAQLLAQHLDADLAGALAPACHAVTGGSPLLVESLAEDQRDRDPDAEGLAVGTAFGYAVLSCVYRGDPRAIDVARAIAVLDDATTPSRVSRLVGLELQCVIQIEAGLTAAGLLDAGRFRNPAAQSAVLHGLGVDGGADLYHRAARLLHDEGAQPAAVARRLVVAGRAGEPWVVPVLEESATRAAQAGDVPRAVEELKLALSSCVDPQHRAKIRAQLTAAEWLVTPATARRHLPELAEAVQDGSLTGVEGAIAIRSLLWGGYVDEARDALEQLESAEPGLHPSTEAARLCLQLVDPATTGPAPGILGGIPTVISSEISAGISSGAVDSSGIIAQDLRATGALAAVLTGGADSAVASARHVLERASLGAATAAGPTVAALLTLLYADKTCDVETWLATLAESPNCGSTPTWTALMAAVEAEAAYRRGRMATAAVSAREAISRISHEGWGVALGGPRATLVRALTAMGSFEEATAQLTMPVPPNMGRTPFGVLYLHARGTYYLAADRLLAALGDFHACGELMQKWGIDVPALVPWRTDAARVFLRLGRHAEARSLIDDQLAQAGGQHPRTRGSALRLLAATTDPLRRPDVLHEAVDLLEDSGDRFELAHALADLGETYGQLGDSGRARATIRQAHHLAEACGAELLGRQLERPAARPADEATSVAEGPAKTLCDALAEVQRPATELSDAEHRVAELAALGHTNRAIASRLFITVSTVEQHLTRVYRKLHVSRRAELARKLGTDVALSA